MPGFKFTGWVKPVNQDPDLVIHVFASSGRKWHEQNGKKTPCNCPKETDEEIAARLTEEFEDKDFIPGA